MPEMSVLVVDDDDRLREAMHEMLTHASLRVVTASEVKKAVELLGQQAFDVVVTDMHFGEERGSDVIRAALALSPRPRVIAITGDMEGFVRGSYGTSGSADVRILPKPFRYAELVYAVCGRRLD